MGNTPRNKSQGRSSVDGVRAAGILLLVPYTMTSEVTGFRALSASVTMFYTPVTAPVAPSFNAKA